jgi:GAF domain-containing protein
VVLGAIATGRAEAKPFTKREIELLETFADQAVMAIDKVALLNETKEALERQTATSEILRVISQSPTDTQPVFKTIVASAARLCDADFSAVARFEGGLLHLVAVNNMSPDEIAAYHTVFPRAPGRHFAIGRAFVDGRPVHIENIETDPDYDPWTREVLSRAAAYRTFLGVPILQNGLPIGAIGCGRHEMKPFTAPQIELVKTFADQAVIAIENVRLFNETKEALERQTATAEILKVISSTPTDAQPVFDAIAKSALHIFGGMDVGVGLVEGDAIQIRAGTLSYAGKGPGARMALDRDSYAGRAVLDRAEFNIADIEAPGTPPVTLERSRAGGWRSIALVPMLREGLSIGHISIHRRQPVALDARQFALLRTFADQAAIAIENARLFNETKEALERQTATSEVLRVISGTPADPQPVFEAIAQSAARVFNAPHASVSLVEGDLLHLKATGGLVDPRQPTLIPFDRTSTSGSAMLEKTTVDVPDTEAAGAPPFARDSGRAVGFRAIASAPMLREGKGIGTITVMRAQPGALTDKQLQLLQTFADQAVIAIENARLFNETKEALERQTATGEILASMSGSMTDTKPVFDAIVHNLLRLFGTSYAVVALRRGEMFELAGFQGEPGFERLQEVYPIPVDGQTVIGEVVIAGQVRKYTPVVGNPAVPRGTAELGQRFGFNSVMVAPMMWKGEAIGAILTARRQALPFDDKQVALIQSFAAQAVIAIENVRLFKELQARTEALTKSVDQLTALGEVGQAISSTLDLETVLKTIVQRAVQLAGLDAGGIYEYDEASEQFHLRAAENMPEEMVEVLRSKPVRKGEGVVGGTAVAREPIQVPDTQDESYKGRLRDLVIRTGRRALLAVPLMHEDHIVGALAVHRNTPGPFATEVVDLLKTFATQSALAIQNARLFREIQEKSAQLEVANKHKSDFLANMSHELRTPLNAIIGFSEALMDRMFGDMNEKQLDYQKDIHESGKHLLSLINDILDLSKIEAGRMELELSTFHFPTAVSNAVTLIRERAMRHGIALGVDIDPRLGDFQADERKVKQILLNLLSNAVKFTPDGGRVEVSAKLDTDAVEIAVKDTGVGT